MSAQDGDYTLNVEIREGKGTSFARRLRREGKIPVNLYGGEATTAISAYVVEREFFHCASKALPSQVFNLKSSDAFLNGKNAIVKEIQRDFIHSKVLHIDMVLLQEGKEVTVKVPLKITGEAYGVKNQGGVLTVILREVELISLPGSIPNVLNVDISNLKLGQRITTGDLDLPKGARLKGTGNEVIANIIAGRAAKTLKTDEASAGGEDSGAQGKAA